MGAQPAEQFAALPQAGSVNYDVSRRIIRLMGVEPNMISVSPKDGVRWFLIVGQALCLCHLATAAHACILSERLLDNPDPTMDCPEDVKNLAERVTICIHWGGEDAYDEERAKEIREAWGKDRCENVPCDAKALLEKYAKEAKVDLVIAKLIKKWADAYGDDLMNVCSTP